MFILESRKGKHSGNVISNQGASSKGLPSKGLLTFLVMEEAGTRSRVKMPCRQSKRQFGDEDSQGQPW